MLCLCAFGGNLSEVAHLHALSSVCKVRPDTHRGNISSLFASSLNIPSLSLLVHKQLRPTVCQPLSLCGPGKGNQLTGYKLCRSMWSGVREQLSVSLRPNWHGSSPVSQTVLLWLCHSTDACSFLWLIFSNTIWHTLHTPELPARRDSPGFFKWGSVKRL